MEKQAYFHGTGRRKTAVAQVRLLPGNGAIIINGVPYEELFTRLEHRRTILQPFLVTDGASKYNAVVKVAGGGISGQSGAISHGIARALVRADESLKSTIRHYGLLTGTLGLKRGRRLALNGLAKHLSTPSGKSRTCWFAQTLNGTGFTVWLARSRLLL